VTISTGDITCDHYLHTAAHCLLMFTYTCWLVTYIPRWFTCLQMVTHPSSNRAQCTATSLIETKVLPDVTFYRML